MRLCLVLSASRVPTPREDKCCHALPSHICLPCARVQLQSRRDCQIEIVNTNGPKASRKRLKAFEVVTVRVSIVVRSQEKSVRNEGMFLDIFFTQGVSKKS